MSVKAKRCLEKQCSPQQKWSVLPIHTIKRTCAQFTDLAADIQRIAERKEGRIPAQTTDATAHPGVEARENEE